MQKEDKRTRLIEAAKTLIYRQGYHRTSLADIAAAAEVPLGNVYYHFRTKESLATAVIDRHVHDLEQLFALWERDPDPRNRLKAFAASGQSISDQISRYGCPHGSLCQDLDKQEIELANAGAHLLQRYLDWSAEQFRLLGKSDTAADLAFDLFASLQGTYLLTESFRSPELLARKIARLHAWIDTL